MVYQCHRCFYVSKNRKDMKKHLNRKNKCLRTIDSYNFDEDLLDEYSLKKISEDQLITKKNSYSNIKTYFGDQKEENNVVVKNDISLDKIDDPFLDNQDLFLLDNNHSNDNHIKEQNEIQNEIQNTVQNTVQNEIQNEHLDKFQADNSILKQKKLDVYSIKNDSIHRSQLEKIKDLNKDSFPKNEVLNFDQVHNKLQNKLETNESTKINFLNKKIQYLNLKIIMSKLLY